MRKFAVVALLALPILALSGQSAQAWCKFGFSFNLQTGGCKWCIDGGQPPAQNTCCTTTPVCNTCMPPAVGFMPLPAPKPVPGPGPVQQSGYWQAGYQPAANYGATGYTGFQTPSYWYGN